MDGDRFKWVGFRNDSHNRVLIKYSDIIEIEDTEFNYVRIHLSNGKHINVPGTMDDIYHHIVKGAGTWY